MTLLAPVGWIGQWLDFGIPILMPIWSEATYWQKYWKAKCKEQKKYGKKPYCTNTASPHTMIADHIPEDKDLTVNKTFIWIGGY